MKNSIHFMVPIFFQKFFDQFLNDFSANFWPFFDQFFNDFSANFWPFFDHFSTIFFDQFCDHFLTNFFTTFRSIFDHFFNYSLKKFLFLILLIWKFLVTINCFRKYFPFFCLIFSNFLHLRKKNRVYLIFFS